MTRDGLGHDFDALVRVPFPNGQLQVLFHVCDNVPTDTLIIGNTALSRSRSIIDSGLRKVTFPVANYIDLENGDSENPRNLECMFRKIPGVTGAITHHEHGVTTLYPQVTSSMVTAARLGYNVMHEVPQGMSCSVAAVAESSAGISGYAEYFSQLPSKEKKRAMVEFTQQRLDRFCFLL